MKDKPDNYYDLAIVDPPYGSGSPKHYNELFLKQYRSKKWNETIPHKKYFNELFRISKNQIIWGGNYYTKYLKCSNSWIFWDKDITGNPGGFADGELAWTSFKNGIRKYKFRIQTSKEKRIHPTQKPIDLYKWLLTNYAKPGQTIFDSYVGSGSIRIACYDLGFSFEGCEKDLDYFNAQEKRYKEHITQNDLFEKKEYQNIIYQGDLL